MLQQSGSVFPTLRTSKKLQKVLQLPQPLTSTSVGQCRNQQRTHHRSSLYVAWVVTRTPGAAPIVYRPRRRRSTQAQSHPITTRSTTGNGWATAHCLTIRTTHGTAIFQVTRHCTARVIFTRFVLILLAFLEGFVS